ncbi:MAG: hypothetical protein IJ652_00695 [Bacteroidales bacterium]|nr:hypothetical protein [Bacteroidales bacterium]
MKKILYAAALLLGLAALGSCKKAEPVTLDKSIIGKWEPAGFELYFEGKKVAFDKEIKLDLHTKLEFLGDGKGKQEVTDPTGASLSETFTYVIDGNKLTVTLPEKEGTVNITKNVVYTAAVNGNTLTLTWDNTDPSFQVAALMLTMEAGTRVDKVIFTYNKK